MLVLKRKINEEIIINADIKIKILSVSDSQVKIGVEAPVEIEIFRGEVFEKVKANLVVASEKSKEKVAGISDLKINKLL
ncbi:MAG: carbon storage regulator CsrA [Melioribacteraceae bacterium]|jgi:carbon storage regulator|nr:carbon storage regulator CsrA [Melioribacteraceae bacterium]